MEFIAYLHKDGKSDYGVSFPDFPGVVTAGKTLEEARRLAAEALALHIQGMVEDGETIPEPSTLDDLVSDPAMKGAVAFLVSASAPDALIRVNITARESQMKQIDLLAEAVGMTRSAYMVRAATATAQRQRREKPGKRRSAAGLSPRAKGA
jgi:predicted RNase H-like HicB family nuclease